MPPLELTAEEWAQWQADIAARNARCVLRAAELVLSDALSQLSLDAPDSPDTGLSE